MGHEHSHHCENVSKKELIALVKHLIGHNEVHANELLELGEALSNHGDTLAYKGILEAVEDFKKGNEKLKIAITNIKDEE